MAVVSLTGLTVVAASGQVLPTVKDISVFTDFQGQRAEFSDFGRGRAHLAADFDNDGRTDIYVASPGAAHYVARNVASPGGQFGFDLVQVLLDGPSAVGWGAAAADYDNDGDIDIFIAQGGNECPSFDNLFRNLWIESGETELSFVDVTAQAGVRGFAIDIDRDGRNDPTASGNAVWVDIDRDGDVDLFVNGNEKYSCDRFKQPGGPDIRPMARNTLWRNNRDGTFTDITGSTGLEASLRSSRHSSFLDIDNDGDMDLYEMNYLGGNLLWRNRLVEDGVLRFEDVTESFSFAGERLSEPYDSFASAPFDVNNDGFEDIFVPSRTPRGLFPPGEPELPGLDCGGEGGRSDLYVHPVREWTERRRDVYPVGHALFVNQEGTGFVNKAFEYGVNQDFVYRSGVMGCQVGDLNGDGVPDLFLGNGSPREGQHNQLLVSDHRASWGVIDYGDLTRFIDLEAVHDDAVPLSDYPSYPYRTHGSTMVDYDGDGLLELGVNNGGALFVEEFTDVEEPNRLFKFEWPIEIHYLTVSPRGDGVHASRDGIGTRVAVTVSDARGTRTLRQRLYGGSCFSGQNGFELFFGLGVEPDVVIDRIEVEWVDGRVDLIENVAVDQRISIDYDAERTR